MLLHGHVRGKREGSSRMCPWMMTLTIVLPSNFAFMLPMATPATAMAYSSGSFRPAEAMRKGLILDLLGLAVGRAR